MSHLLAYTHIKINLSKEAYGTQESQALMDF